MSETTWATSDFRICINLKTVLSLFFISELATVISVTMCHFVNNVLILIMKFQTKKLNIAIASSASSERV